jgi:recombination protein RecA
VEKNIIQKAGAWYSYGEEKIGQGRDAVMEFLNANTDIMEKIQKKLRIELNIPTPGKVEDNKDRPAKKE